MQCLNLADTCVQANATAAEKAYARKHGAGTLQEGRRVWGPNPPPQHAALLRGRLALAAVGHADGRTLIAQVKPPFHLWQSSNPANKNWCLRTSCMTMCAIGGRSVRVA